MQHRYHLTRLSTNMKLGGIPASTSSRSTCPDRCSLKKSGCYGDAGPISIHWDAVSSGRRGTDFDTHCEQVRRLPISQLWRAWQVGDFPGNAKLMDQEKVRKLVKANKGRKAFSFTHYNPREVENAALVKYANSEGFTINLSAETLEEADEFVELGVGPVVVLLPADQTENLTTPAGNHVIVCPASLGNTTCALCAICAVPTRKSVVGFPAHGTSKKKVEKVFWAQALQPA